MRGVGGVRMRLTLPVNQLKMRSDFQPDLM